MFDDKVITCKECHSEFTFTAGEQRFYADKGFENEPGRCPDCRAANKKKRTGKKVFHETMCAECGVSTQVPFEPKNGRPVYCRDCYKNMATKK